MNKCIFIGNLTRDPEYQTTGSGVSLCRFSIAVNRSYSNANGERETDFINIVTWRGLADNCSKYLFKGSKVCVVGQLQNRTYEDKDGNKLTDFISIKVRGPLAERCAAFAWKGCKLAATGDFETITFADDPQRQPGFLIKASDVEFLSPRKAEGAAQAVEDMSASEDAA